MGSSRFGLVIAGLFLLGGCIAAELVPCGDLVCAGDAICLDDQRCATPEQLASCEGLLEDDLCRGVFGDGRCVGGVCTANVCGDGFVTGTEDCDGTDIPLTCEDLGYYAGTPSCASYCAIDRAGCIGRCGDGTLQPEREDCDGGPPTGTCVGYGRDYGILGCSRSCAPDIAADCLYFGWETLMTTSGQIGSAAANAHGAIALVGNVTFTANVVWKGVRTTRSGADWNRAVATADALFAIGNGSAAWFDDAGWHDIAVTPGPGSVAVTDSGILYIVHSGCAITRIDPATAAMSSIMMPPATQCQSAATHGEILYVADFAAGTLRWDGAWTTALVIPSFQVTRGRAGTVVAATEVEKYELDPAGVAPPELLPGSRRDQSTLAYDDEGLELDVETDEGASSMMRAGQITGFVDRRPPDMNRIGRAADGTVIGWGTNLYRAEPQLARRSTPIAVGDQVTLRVLDDGALAYFGSKLGWMDSDGDGSYLWFGAFGIVNDVIGDLRAGNFIASGTNGIHRWNAATGSFVTEVNGAVTSLAGDLTNAFAVVSAQVRRRVGTTWVLVDIPGCSMQAVAGRTQIYALGQCGVTYTLFRWDGSAFVAVTTSANLIHSPYLGYDGTLVVGMGSQQLMLVGSTLQVVGTTFQRVVVVSPDDVFVPGVSEWTHVRGSTSSAVRLPVGPAAATPFAFYVLDSQRNLQILPRMPSRHAANGL